MAREKILVIFEFPPGEHEWQLRDLTQGLQARHPDWEFAFCSGWIGRYQPGGLKPMRILNGLWVHLRAALLILFGRWHRVLVRSSPPLIQMTVATACRLRRVKYWVWLMDAHPELEAELWRTKPGLGHALRLLEAWNRTSLRGAEVVVVLDAAMRRRLTAHCEPAAVVICPTWANGPHPRIAAGATAGSGTATVLRLVYLGNLGMAHDIALFADFLRACTRTSPVELVFYGTTPETVAELRRQAGGERVTIEANPPVPFVQLAQVLPPRGFDFGIVTLRKDFAGLVSPSKFIGYLVAGVPLVCLGPPETNAALVCDELGAGVRLERSDLETGTVPARLADMAFRRNAPGNCDRALRYFAGFDGAFLAAEISRRTTSGSRSAATAALAAPPIP